jgi:galactokinase
MIVGILIIASATGCASGLTATETLDQTLHYFHHHLVAGDIERAHAYVSSAALEDFRSLHDPEKNLNLLVEFSVLTVTPVPMPKDDLRKQAVAIVAAQVRRDDSITIRKVRYRQLWERSGDRWMLLEESLAEPGRGDDFR